MKFEADGMTSEPSVPAPFRMSRPLTQDEIDTLRCIADLLIPPAGPQNPGATSELGFNDALITAAHARADAFDAITKCLAELHGADAATLDRELRTRVSTEPDVFQALSAVIVGAWLLLPDVRQRIGYTGQRRNVAPLEQIADELSTGILEPVIDRGPIYTPAPPG